MVDSDGAAEVFTMDSPAKKRAGDGVHHGVGNESFDESMTPCPPECDKALWNAIRAAVKIDEVKKTQERYELFTMLSTRDEHMNNTIQASEPTSGRKLGNIHR